MFNDLEALIKPFAAMSNLFKSDHYKCINKGCKHAIPQCFHPSGLSQIPTHHRKILIKTGQNR